MNSLDLGSLQPELIAGVYGRTRSLTSRLILRRATAKARVILLSAACLIAIFAIASQKHLLIGSGTSPSVVGVMLHPGKLANTIQLPLLQDPVGLLVVLTCLATPVFCAEQVAAIRAFVPMNEQNTLYRAEGILRTEVRDDIARANARFEFVGRRATSVAILIGSVVTFDLILSRVERDGLYASWNFTAINDDVWSGRVYSGWWANGHNSQTLAIVLWCAGTLGFYFLFKQLAMGLVFAAFARSALLHEFGVAPNMSYNTDGHWGLRPLRRFMQWTYGSTLAHFVATLGFSIAWLPFAQWTVFLVLGVMTANFLVVLYPSSIAYNAAVREKQRFVLYVLESDLDWRDKEARTEKVWTRPDLPFRTRSTLSAATLYLLVPLLLAVVSSILSR